MGFVNWRAVNAVYCALIWMVAIALVCVIVAYGVPQGPAPAHHGRAALLR
jgi:hypothetical protein